MNVDIRGLDVWFGAFVEADVFFVAIGASWIEGFAINCETSERCNFSGYCRKFGAGLLGAISANGIVVDPGPKCGKNLSKTLSGKGIGADGAAMAGAGTSSNFRDTSTLGFALGGGGAVYGYVCNLWTTNCFNTPCECR